MKYMKIDLDSTPFNFFQSTCASNKGDRLIPIFHMGLFLNDFEHNRERERYSYNLKKTNRLTYKDFVLGEYHSTQ